MLLTIDIGNTHTVIGLFQQKELCHHWRLKTDRHATHDEIASLLHGLFALQNLDPQTITGTIIGSVVPDLKSAWQTFCQQYLDLPTMVVGSAGIDPGLKVQVRTPLEVGADRLINAVAGFHRYPQALIIVDFGTAITFDCVSAQGDYLGGAIAPGLGISLEALSSQTAKLPKIDITKETSTALGTTTEEAIRAGILFGYGGLVEGLATKLAREFPQPPMTIATGGMAHLIAPYAPVITHVEPTLTLEGLQIIHARNVNIQQNQQITRNS